MSETVTHARRLMLGEPLPLRIGYTGPRSREFLDGAVTAVAADPGAVEGLDAVVLEPEAPVLDAVADAARAAGTPVVALGAD